MKLLKTWDEDEKASAIKILGLLVGAFTLFILISTTSYLFTWQADMSLLESPSSDSAHNAAGKGGCPAHAGRGLAAAGGGRENLFFLP